MAWTDIDQYSVPQLIDKAALDTLKANILYLHQTNQASYAHPGTGSDYTVTGSLGVDLDGTNFALTITTTGGLVMAAFHGSLKISVAAQAVRMAIIRDEPITQTGRNLFYNFDVDVAQTVSCSRGWIKPFVGLPAGSHTFRVVWGVSGGTGTLEVAYPPFFAVWEA